MLDDEPSLTVGLVPRSAGLQQYRISPLNESRGTFDTGGQTAIMPGSAKSLPIVCLIPRLAAIMLSTETESDSVRADLNNLRGTL